MSFYQEGNIKEVYAENLTDEIRIISDTLEDFNYISMDTEFPGIIFPLNQNSIYSSKNIQQFLSNPTLNPTKTEKNITQAPPMESNYRTIKYNVDNLKLIQIGITLSNEDGAFPEDISTWQFNFKFDLDHDAHLNESINMLEIAGINFKSLKENGIDMDYFGEILTTSGIVLNDNVKWIIFHGCYDLAYMIKILSNQPLPDDETGFNDLLGLYFPTFYDVRQLIKKFSWIKGSLSKIAADLDISRIGNTHQAGSDSLVTAKVFYKLLNSCDLFGDRNKLFGFSYKNFDEFDQFSNFTQHMNSIPYSGVHQINSSVVKNLLNQGISNPSSNIPPMYGFQSMSNFGNFNNFSGGNIPMTNMQGVNPVYYNMSGYNSMYPQQMDYNYFGNFYNGGNNSSAVPASSMPKGGTVKDNSKTTM